MGIDAVSSAQSKRAGDRVERRGTELAGGETGDGGGEMVASWDSDTLAVIEDMGGGGVVVALLFFRSCWCPPPRAVVGSETARFRAHWGWVGCMGSKQGTGDEWRVSLGVDDVVGDEAAV